MKFDQYDFEQQIMKCWDIIKDLETVYESLYEEERIDNDLFGNTMLGLISLYEMKFKKLYAMSEAIPRTGTQVYEEELNASCERTKEKIRKALDDCSMEEWDRAAAERCTVGEPRLGG